MIKQKKYIEFIYIISVILAFGLLFYANAEENKAPDGTIYRLGIGKTFYYPCAIALISSFFLKRKYDAFEFCLYCLVLIAIISSIIHPPKSTDILRWTSTRFIFAILCFRDLRFINPKLFIKYLTIASPLIVIPHYIFSNPFSYGDYRYGGFYGDANFLAIALNFIIVICYLSFTIYKNIPIRLCCTISVIGSIPLILLGMSRGGLFGLMLIIIFIAINAYKYNKKLFFFVAIVLFFLLRQIIGYFAETMIHIEERYTEGDLDARIDGIKSVINVLSNLPEIIPFGIGPGNTASMKYLYRTYGFYCDYDVHNTFFAILYEMGIFAFLLYLYLYLHTFISLFLNKQYLLLGLFISSIFSLSTLPGIAFMPGWILLFFISNSALYSNRNN